MIVWKLFTMCLIFRKIHNNFLLLCNAPSMRLILQKICIYTKCTRKQTRYRKEHVWQTGYVYFQLMSKLYTSTPYCKSYLQIVQTCCHGLSLANHVACLVICWCPYWYGPQADVTGSFYSFPEPMFLRLHDKWWKQCELIIEGCSNWVFRLRKKEFTLHATCNMLDTDVRFLGGAGFLFATTPRPALGSTYHLSNTYRGLFLPYWNWPLTFN